MQKLLLMALAITSAMVFSQNQRFSYDYTFISDSLSRENSQTELMYLDISKKGSKFYSRNKAVADSIIDEGNRKKEPVNFSVIKFGLVSFVIEKSYSDQKVVSFDRLEMDEFKVSDDRNINWKILPEKEKIGELMTQKATTNFAGRLWTAWFTTEIPLQDGPYKFRGLPGLIVKIEDRTKSHSFVLNGIKNLGSKDWISISEKDRFHPLVNLPIDKFNKMVIEYRKNPTKGMRQKIVKMVDEKGNELDMNEMMRKREKDAEKNNAKNNNLLELDILRLKTT
ncbi:GLPGLI family protein [Chryseobacterium sp.]|uniref:GLPGLI family protein n=1 Tax=Chryseobacterium sp. TaxID=1871047 RepID=UPI00388F30FC